MTKRSEGVITHRDWRHQRRSGPSDRQLEVLREHIGVLTRLGFSLAEIAAAAGTSRPTVSRLLAGGSVSSAVAERLWETEPPGRCPTTCPCRAYRADRDGRSR